MQGGELIEAVKNLTARWREWYEERAAIMEYVANMDRATAERLAMDEVLEMMRRERESKS